LTHNDVLVGVQVRLHHIPACAVLGLERHVASDRGVWILARMTRLGCSTQVASADSWLAQAQLLARDRLNDVLVVE
jgi:hypothetical protein